MQTDWIVEVSALIVRHAALLWHLAPELPMDALLRIDELVRARSRRWSEALAEFTLQARAGDKHARQLLWLSLEPHLEEMLLADMLTRVWCATLAGHDRWFGVRRHAERVDAWFLDQARHTSAALDLVRSSPYAPLPRAARLNRWRRRVEIWTDFLLAEQVASYGAERFAFSIPRAQTYAADLVDRTAGGDLATAWTLWLVSLRASFTRRVDESLPQAELHRELAALMLGCFPSMAFDHGGKFYSPWLARVREASVDRPPPAIVKANREVAPSQPPASDRRALFDRRV